jgi:hypothetical protein
MDRGVAPGCLAPGGPFTIRVNRTAVERHSERNSVFERAAGVRRNLERRQ